MDALDICARLVLHQAPSRCPGTLHTVDLSEAGVPFSLRGDTPGSHGCSLIHLIILHFSYGVLCLSFSCPNFPGISFWLFLGGRGSDSGCYDCTRFSLGFSFQTESPGTSCISCTWGIQGSKEPEVNTKILRDFWYVQLASASVMKSGSVHQKKTMFLLANSTIFSLDAACSFQEGQVGRAEGSNESFCSTRGDLCAGFIIHNHTLYNSNVICAMVSDGWIHEQDFFSSTFLNPRESNIHLMLQDLQSLQERTAQEKELERDAGTWGVLQEPSNFVFHHLFVLKEKKHQQKLTIVTYDCLQNKQPRCGNLAELTKFPEARMQSIIFQQREQDIGKVEVEPRFFKGL